MAEEKPDKSEKPESVKVIKIKVPKINFWMISTLVLLVISLILLVRPGVLGTGPSGAVVLSANDAANKAIDYINKNLVQSGQATFVSVGDFTSYLYKVTTNYQGSDIDIYVSKDGQLLFVSSPLDMTKTSNTTTTQAPSFNPNKTEIPNVKFFVMSFCPYGNQAEEGLGPALRLLGSKVTWEPHYVIYSNYGSGYPDYCLDKDNKYCSMHGIQELNQDVRELCVYKYAKDKWWDFVDAVNANCTAQNVDTCWIPIATKVGLDVKKIQDCQANEATTLLAAEVALSEQYGVQGSPSVFVNDAQYNGGRTPDAYKQAICSAFVTAPSECSQTLSSSGNASSSSGGGCG